MSVSQNMLIKKQAAKAYVSEKTKTHPLIFPIVSSATVACAGSIVGYAMPVEQDVFVSHALYNKSDKLLKAAQHAYTYETYLEESLGKKVDSEIIDFAKGFGNKVNKSISNKKMKKVLSNMADEFLLEVKVLLGESAFEKVVSDYPNERMLKSGKKMLAMEAKEKTKACKVDLENLYKFMQTKNGKHLKDKMYDVFKSARSANSKNVAIITGFSTLFVAGLYSYIKTKEHYHKDKLSGIK